MKYNSPHYPIHHIIDNNPYIKQIDAVNKMAQELRNWNLKHDSFPDLTKWIDTFWTAPFGKEEALDFLNESATARAKSYWGVQPMRGEYLGQELDISRNKWQSIIKDLKGSSRQGLSAKWKLDTTPLDPFHSDDMGQYVIDSVGIKHYIDTSRLESIDGDYYWLPKLKKNPAPKYKLINTEKEFKNSHPPIIPSLQIRKSLKPKHYAKVIFQGKPRERMWIKITKLVPGGYEGILDNSPTYLKNVKYGDVIRIKYGDIIGIMRPSK